MTMDRSSIAVLDYGSQYSQLIVRRIREIGYFSRLHLPGEREALESADGVVLSGGPRSVQDTEFPDIDLEFLQALDVPILGICYGMQLLNVKWGGGVSSTPQQEYGPSEIEVEATNTLFDGVPRRSTVWMSHADSLTDLPDSAQVLARNLHRTPVAVQWSPRFYGIQFHPEVSHTEYGTTILRNFLSLVDPEPDFSMDTYRDDLVEEIRREVGDREVVCGVSGGVDSSVLVTLLLETGVEVRPVFVDSGLLRKNEAAEVQQQFHQLGIEIEVVEAQDRFLDAIEGITDPEEKRNRIGDTFLDVFFDHVGEVELLGQGTLYPDVIESATSGSDASTIKTHHNRVGKVLELQRQGRVLEPLDELFKDEVRELGEVLGMPERILYRHPFPGPGLAIRIPGEVTPDKLRILREVDDVFINVLRDTGWYQKSWQAFCVLLPVRSVGVKGDERSYEYAVSVRSVNSKDGMTADWTRFPHSLLERISNEILNRVSGVNRVLYDISTKPPSSIEWE